ncbi:MAG TPA: LCP family protein [Anaerolineales bacterium]|nr:LCP family protein [Anaerolineales bacterium]
MWPRRRHPRSALLVALLLAGVACAPIAGGLLPAAGPFVGPSITPNPFATTTGTAFAPLAPTATTPPTETPTPTPLVTPTSENPWGYYPGPMEASAIDIPKEMPVIPFSENVVNVIVLGSDQRPYGGGHRTDVMMVVSLDPDRGTVTLLSIPRDLYVYIPGWRVDRVNVADIRGGPDLVAMTILYNFGIRIDYFVEIDFGGFIALVDNLGGIDVQITGYLSDECGRRNWNYSPGVRHMDGFAALCYVRMRKHSSDFDRLRRQQEVIVAIFHKAASLDGLSRLPELHAAFNQLVDTDMPLDKMVSLVPLGTRVLADPSLIRRFTVDTSMADGWRVPYSGAAVQLPIRDAILRMLATAFPP